MPPKNSHPSATSKQKGFARVQHAARHLPLVEASKVKNAQLRTLLEDSWRFTAPKKLVQQFG